MRIVLRLILLLTISIPGYSQENIWDQVEQDIHQLMDSFHTVGISVAVVKHDSVIYSNGFGYRDLENQKPVTPNTSFGIGSVSKHFTAALMGIYEGRNLLSVNDRPSAYIDDINFYTDAMDSIVTIEDLIAHRAGIGNVDGSMVFFPDYNLRNNLSRLPYLEPSSQVRDRFDYSNMGYTILGALAEQIIGKSWGDQMKEEIFDPLGMKQSNTSIDALQSSEDYSMPYSVSDNQAVRVLFDPLHGTGPGGSINSSALDMAKWMQLLLDGGKLDTSQIIPKDYLHRAFSGQNLIRERFSFDQKDDILFDNYGYGLGVHSYHGYYKLQHGGAVSGFTASIDMFPFEGIGIVVLCNQHVSSIPYHIADMISRRMLDMDPIPWDQYEVRTGTARNYGQALEPLNRDSLPTLPLHLYEGSYVHPGYGEIIIDHREGQLYIKFPAFEMGLEHTAGDWFWNKRIHRVHENSPAFDMSFQTNLSEVISLNFPFRSQGVLFEKTN